MEQQDSFQLGELEYWRFKAKMAELELERITLQNAINNLEERKKTLMLQTGLDNTRNYRLDDQKFTIELAK